MMAPKQNGGSNHGNVLVFTQQQYHWETHHNVYKHLESNIMGQKQDGGSNQCISI